MSETTKTTIGDTISNEKKARIATGLAARGKNGNPAVEAIDESGRVDILPTGGTQLDRMEAMLQRSMTTLENHRQELISLDERVDALEAKPDFLAMVEGLIKAEGEAAMKSRDGVHDLVLMADTQGLPWGIRHVAKARRSTLGQAIETVALLAIGGYAAYLGGEAGYHAIKGNGMS